MAPGGVRLGGEGELGDQHRPDPTLAAMLIDVPSALTHPDVRFGQWVAAGVLGFLLFATALSVILFLAVVPIMVINVRNLRRQGIGS